MRLTKDAQKMELPEYIKFGLELEVENVNYSKITKIVKEKNWHTDKDQSLTDSGVECVSPVLSENSENNVWEEVNEICEQIKKNPKDIKREAYTDHTCGGHIHFDTTIFRENPNMMENFLRLWAESEELIYKMCNDKNDPIRPSALDVSHTTILEIGKTFLKSPINANRKINVLLSDILVSRQGMASPISQKIKKQLEQGKLRLGKPLPGIFRNKMMPERYRGLNLTNLGSRKKNTIEFRMSNGTINPQTIKENVFLYSSIIDTALQMTKNPEKVQEKLQNLYRNDINEEEKVNAFLEPIMEREEDKKIYKERWESVKDAPVFKSKGSKNFAKDTFKRDDYNEIAEEVPGYDVKKAFSIINQMKQRIMGNVSKNKEEEIGFEH